jgi:SAM-dependent methyltransferase
MAERIQYLALDTLDLLLGKRDRLTPPRRMIFVGGGGFRRIGEAFLGYFVELCGLKPNERVLDVGCGVGRMAVPLTKYMDNTGSYEGFDIVARGIKWCRKRISPRYPNFSFQLADVFNRRYNPHGKHKASEYRFPYEHESFDFVFLTSVFTHMLPQDMENYFSEIVRVLKRGGRCLITFFLLNEESLELINARRIESDDFDFRHQHGEYRTTCNSTHEAAVCYDEAYVLGLHEKHGLRIRQPIHYGSWCGRSDFLSRQDIIISSKT